MNDAPSATVEPLWDDEYIAGHIEAHLRDFAGNELEAELVELVQLVRDETLAEADEVMAGQVQRAYEAMASILDQKDVRIAELEQDNAALRAQAAIEWEPVSLADTPDAEIRFALDGVNYDASDIRFLQKFVFEPLGWQLMRRVQKPQEQGD